MEPLSGILHFQLQVPFSSLSFLPVSVLSKSFVTVSILRMTQLVLALGVSSELLRSVTKSVKVSLKRLGLSSQFSLCSIPSFLATLRGENIIGPQLLKHVPKIIPVTMIWNIATQHSMPLGKSEHEALRLLWSMFTLFQLPAWFPVCWPGNPKWVFARVTLIRIASMNQ